MVPKFLLIASIFGAVNAESYSESLQEKPPEFKDEEGCYVERIKEIIPYEGFTILPRECMRIDCNLTQITYSTCDVEELPSEPYCFFENDPNVFYPDCCPRIKCIEEEDFNDEV